MASSEIVRWPAGILTRRTERVVEFGTPELRQLLADMRKIISGTTNLGVAAPQVGVPVRVAIALLAMPTPKRPARLQLVDLVNLEVEPSGGQVTTPMREGCLSFPGQWAQVPRWRRVYARWQTVEGEAQSGTFDGLSAQVLQHEVDHLAGMLFVDRIGAMRAREIRTACGGEQMQGLAEPFVHVEP